MRHATPETLKSIESLLDQLRTIDGLREKKAGVFYRKSRAFLHFHEDAEGVFADVRLTEPDFDRLPVNTATERRALISAIRALTAG